MKRNCRSAANTHADGIWVVDKRRARAHPLCKCHLSCADRTCGQDSKHQGVGLYLAVPPKDTC